MLLLLSSLALAEPAIPCGPIHPWVDGGLTDTVQLVARDDARDLLVWRQVYHHQGGVPCGHPDMAAHPTSGVSLVLWDTRRRRPARAWVIYEAARSADQCQPHDQAVLTLDDARTTLTNLGLDMGRPQDLQTAPGWEPVSAEGLMGVQRGEVVLWAESCSAEDQVEVMGGWGEVVVLRLRQMGVERLIPVLTEARAAAPPGP